MRTKIFTAALLSTLILTSCDNDNQDTIKPSKYITVSAEMGALTRVAGTDFEQDDQISIYAWTGDPETVSSELVVNNSINTFDGTSIWTADPLMLWQDMTTLHYFIGVHPTKSITNFTSDSYSEIPDLLIAAELNGYSSEKSNLGIVPLTFEHIMARLDVNLTFRTQWGTVPTVTSVDVEAKSGALVNYIKKTATANGGASNIIMSNITPNAAYEKVLVPQKINNINIVIDGKTYTYNNVDGFELQKGKIQTVNLIVGKDKITLGSVLITEWGDGNTIDGGEAQID